MTSQHRQERSRIVGAIWHRLELRWKRAASATAAGSSSTGRSAESSPASAAVGPVPWPWSCLNEREESGRWDTWAGGLGFVYSPLSYGGVAVTLAAQFGDSWPAWPPWAQIEVGEQVQRESGWSAWSTAAACGL